MKRAFLLLSLIGGLAACSFGQTGVIGLNGKTELLQFKEVKKEISFTKEQDKQLSEMMAEMSKNPGFGTMPNMHYMTKGIDEKIDTILTDLQRARLQELFLQKNGLMTLSEDDVCQTLGLSDDVKAQARSVIKAFDKGQMDTLMAHPGKYDRKAMDAQKEKALADLAALLTPEQSEKWTTMQGKPFKFPKMG